MNCSEEKRKCVVAVDAFETRAQFCQSPKSAVEGATLGGTTLTAALVHGFGESVYYYWAAGQVCGETNLTVEVIWHILLRIDDLNKLKGIIPLFIFTADNASDNKSIQFLAFIAYLVEMEVFDFLKVNYLFVGLTATGILHQR